MDNIQNSFSGGMNLFLDDTRLAENEYRSAFNIRNRFDVLEPILTALDIVAPAGKKQGLYSFGEYLLAFVSGAAWYKFRSETGWHQIPGFLMNAVVDRYYVAAVPVSTVQFGREQVAGATSVSSALNLVNTDVVVAGTPAGLLVQDGINQPWFLYIAGGVVIARLTQKFSEWAYDSTGENDRREYVPIGRFMEWSDGILYMVSPDGERLYRSVTGRPLDFVVNVDINGDKGGDAETTAYSVGVGGITAIKSLGSIGLFVSASNRLCFSVTPNRTPGALTICGEPTFIRTYLFDAGCMNEKGIVDILGDFAFIDPEGLRSFNAVLQQQNEGRNSIFSLKVSALFKGLLQDESVSSAIVFDNYALFSMKTIYGYIIVVYDTLNKVFVGLDTQVVGAGIKQFAKIDTNVTELYAITSDDRLVKLYAGTEYATALVRLRSQCSQNPSMDIQPSETRIVLTGFRVNSTMMVTTFVNNRLSGAPLAKTIPFIEAPHPYFDAGRFDGVDSQVNNLLFNLTGANQGWKMFHIVVWTGGGAITNVEHIANDVTPLNPLLSQALDFTNRKNRRLLQLAEDALNRSIGVEVEGGGVTPPPPEPRYQNTPQSYTAECAVGLMGAPITVTKDAGLYFSNDSQADADNKALVAATEEALAELVCVAACATGFVWDAGLNACIPICHDEVTCPYGKIWNGSGYDCAAIDQPGGVFPCLDLVAVACITDFTGISALNGAIPTTIPTPAVPIGEADTNCDGPMNYAIADAQAPRRQSGATVDATKAYGGAVDLSRLYTVTIRVRGVFEWKGTYGQDMPAGSVGAADPDQPNVFVFEPTDQSTGWIATATPNAFGFNQVAPGYENEFWIDVRDFSNVDAANNSVQRYMLNFANPRVTVIQPVDYTFKIVVQSGQKVSLQGTSCDLREYFNPVVFGGTPAVVGGAPIAIKFDQPYQGQFVQLDVISIDY